MADNNAQAPATEQPTTTEQPAATPAETPAATETAAPPQGQHSVLADQEKESPIFEIFSRDVRIPGIEQNVQGEEDPEAHRKLPHILNTARTRHTLQGADEPQLTGILPVSKALQKALKGEQDRFKKAMDRAKKLEKKENKWRDEAVKRVETRLEKEMKEMKALLEAENKKQPADERQTPQEIEDMAKKLKWRHWKEYDRVISQAHLDNMACIYRLRMLDMLPCLENLQVAEWEELMVLEEGEFKDLEKKHGIEIKRLNSNLRWGKFVSKVKGSKAMDDGETVKKAEFAEYAEQRTKSTVESHTSELDQLRLSQAERRANLKAKQTEIMDSYIQCQDQIINDIKLDDMTGVVAARRATTAGSQDALNKSTPSTPPASTPQPAATSEAPAATSEAPAAAETTQPTA